MKDLEKTKSVLSREILRCESFAEIVETLEKNMDYLSEYNKEICPSCGTRGFRYDDEFFACSSRHKWNIYKGKTNLHPESV